MYIEGKMDNLVKQCRKDKDWSQAELAIQSGISQATISDIERKRYIPRVDVALRVAKALNSTVEELFIL